LEFVPEIRNPITQKDRGETKKNENWKMAQKPKKNKELVRVSFGREKWR